ncbi:hypothetical protein EWM64_g6151 [Hericium alpestre]|uniref:BAR domain-containing protein n=1 Tax=Hericium alpestre TaxID=135208 RepID=A0A4Y9ZVF6_9AGAM|nr:hypothetical protein EWM64_g6151 [Hericium alpestre]
MAQTGTSIQAIADRPEIHKCCRSLEAVVNLLSDYTEAARAVVTLQKKLAKALREAAGLKATGDIPGNTFTVSAGLFEVLSDVDGKFAKLVDKECDTVSGEVRKWFKKLAKEEKAHDDKINAANAKIKQAGQNYEKKAKKTAYDAADEHARYIALLSSLGPEVQQEKYNHALTISQRNTSITYTVAGTLARVADAEWLRVSENVRRFAPLIGQGVGQEAATDSARSNPDDAVQADVPPSGTDTLARPEARPASRPGDRDREPQSISTSLASFPSPPTHFPIPPVSASSSKPGTPVTESPLTFNRELATLRDAKGQRASGSSSDASHSSPGSSGIAVTPALSKVDEAPGQERSMRAGPRNEAVLDTPALTDGSMSPPTPRAETPVTPPASGAYAFPTRSDGKGKQRAGLGINTIVDERADEGQREPASGLSQLSSHLPPPTSTSASTSNFRSSSYNASGGGAFKKGDYLEEREFGVDAQQDQDRTRSLDDRSGFRATARRPAITT